VPGWHRVGTGATGVVMPVFVMMGVGAGRRAVRSCLEVQPWSCRAFVTGEMTGASRGDWASAPEWHDLRGNGEAAPEVFDGR
jgi:hypothetical protein